MVAKKRTGVGSIEGVGAKTEKMLISGGLDTIRKVADAKPADLRACGITTENAKTIIRNALDMFDPRTVARLHRQLAKERDEVERLRAENHYLTVTVNNLYRVADELTKLKKPEIDELKKLVKDARTLKESMNPDYVPIDDCPPEMYR